MEYVNEHGDPVRIIISNHARVRFLQRMHRVFPRRPLPADPDSAIAGWFAAARLLEPKGKYLERSQRHGEGTLYFFAPPFVFIVEGSVLVTVELGGRSNQGLNRDCLRIEARDDDALPRPERFRIVGWTVGDDGSRNQAVKLGNIDGFVVAGRPERLRGDERFLQLARERFEAKRPGRRLIAIWVRPTGEGRSVWIWGDQAPFARVRELREAS